MSDRTPRRRNRIAGQFSWRTIEMMESPVFQGLSLTARRILDRLEIELAHHGGKDNGRLPLTFNQLVEFGISNRRQIAAALREVCALGFAEITQRGIAGNAEFRKPNLFRLTYRPVGNAQPTNEWKAITKEATIGVARQARNTPAPRQRKAKLRVVP